MLTTKHYMTQTQSRGRERHDEDWSPGTANVHTGESKEPMWTIFSGLFSLTLGESLWLMK